MQIQQVLVLGKVISKVELAEDLTEISISVLEKGLETIYKTKIKEDYQNIEYGDLIMIDGRPVEKNIDIETFKFKFVR